MEHMIRLFKGTLLPITLLALVSQEKLDGHVLQHAIR